MRELLCLIIISAFLSCQRKAGVVNVKIDALYPGSWNGLVLVKDQQAMAFRFNTFRKTKDSLIYISGKELDNAVKYYNNGSPIYHSVKKVDIKAADLSYAGLVWGDEISEWSLEWSVEDAKVVGRLSSSKVEKQGIVVECYIPWDYPGELKYENDEITGIGSLVLDHSPDAVLFGTDSLIRTEILKDYLLDGTKMVDSKGRFIYLVYYDQSSLFFSSGFEENLSVEKEEIKGSLIKQKTKELARRPEITGEYEAVIPALVDNLNWMICHIPKTEHTYIPAGRTWDWGGWAIFEWDAFFNSLLLSVDNPEMSFKNLKALYSTQYENGNLPNYRCEDSGSEDHSQPAIGSYIVWKLYQKTGDRQYLELSYPHLKSWYNWWMDSTANGNTRRDGNGDGLLEWGSDILDSRQEDRLRSSKFESGADDSPLWDSASYDLNTWTMDLNAIDINSFRILDMEFMAKIATELGRIEEASTFKQARLEHIRRVNEQLWNEKKGFYFGRFWDGTWNYTYAAQNFYPLIAGIADKNQAQHLVDKLTDTTLYWGKYIVPTLAKNDPRYPEQQYWRGTIWPPVNYLIYQGLKRYQYDSLAAVFAQKSATLFLDNYRKNGGACQENYDSRTGEGGGQKYQSWGPLYSMILLEEIIDIDPEGGLRVGSLGLDELEYKKLEIRGDRYDIFLEKGLILNKNGEEVLRTTKPAVLRRLEVTAKSISGEIHCKSPATVISASLRDSIQIQNGIHSFSLTYQN